jgi:hypothetical protein
MKYNEIRGRITRISIALDPGYVSLANYLCDASRIVTPTKRWPL